MLKRSASRTRQSLRTSAKRAITTDGDGTILIDNKRIGYAVFGHGTHSVLFLPGALGSYKSDFQRQLEEFDQSRFRLIGWDPPGYGRSRPPDRDFNGHFYRHDAAMAHKLMEALGYGSSYSLVGWSDGGITAMIMAAKYSTFVKRLVVFGANAYVTKTDIELCEAIADLSKWSGKMRAPFEAMYDDEYFRRMWTDWQTAFKRFYTDQPGGDICKNELKLITCPTLIIHGSKDALVAPEHCHHLKESISNSELIILSGGRHNLHLKQWKEFNSVVQEFLLRAEFGIGLNLRRH